MKIIIPEKIRIFIEDKQSYKDSAGMSGATIIMYDDMVLKIEKESVLTERQSIMLRWLDGKLPVPQILAEESEKGFCYTLMSRIGGKTACSEECMLQPETTISAIAEGFRLLWAVNTEACPYTYSFNDMLIDGQRHLEKIDRKAWAGHFSTPEQQLVWLENNKPEDDFVFAHGDFCMPNIMIESGKVVGFIDMAQCGKADRWYDYTLMKQSIARNRSGFFGGRCYGGWRDEMLRERLGIVEDQEKITWCLLMDEISV